MTPPFDAVLFDLDDTLCDDTASYRGAAELVAHEVAALRGIDALRLKNAYIAASEGFWQKLTHEQLGKRLSSLREHLWAEALSACGIDEAALAERCADSYHAHRRTNLKLFPGVAEALGALRARGTKLGLVTNGFAETHHEKISILQIGEFFDAIFIADEVGMIKPDPRIFLHACETLGAEPLRSVMVGDRYDRDIIGALDAGLFTVFMNVHRQTLAHDARTPHVTVADFSGVPAALGIATAGSAFPPA